MKSEGLLKVFAKTDRYYVREYEEETNLRCHLMLAVQCHTEAMRRTE